MKSALLKVAALCLIVGGLGSVSYSLDAERPLFFTPTGAGGQVEVLAALNGAQTSIHMTMYNLTDESIISALTEAKNRGVEVKLIMDQGNASRKVGGPFDRLVQAGVDARKSSDLFSITHTKAFTVDGNTSYVMTLNLTKISDRVRDVALITSNPDDVKFMEDLFTTDWDNAGNHTMNTPSDIPANFVVAPVNAKDRLMTLINSAQTSLQIEVENLSYTEMIQAMVDAQARGVKVEVLLPRCNLSKADFDMPAALTLHQGGVDVRLMPDPESADTPYIHQKSIVVDGVKAFLGSENFSFNSIEKARELGIIFADPSQVKQLAETFEVDFAKSLDYAAAEAFACPKSPFMDEGHADLAFEAAASQ